MGARTKTQTRRDREVTRMVHRLFWRANFEHPASLIIAYCLRIPAFMFYNIFIPLEIAYGIQAIVTRQFDQVSTHAVRVLLFALGYCITWSIGDLFIAKNGITGGAYLQKRVFSNFLQKDYEFYGNAHFGALGSEATKLRDAYVQYCQMFTVAVPKQITIVVAGIVVIGYHSILLALVTLGAMLITLSFTIVSTLMRLPYRRIVSAANSKLAGAIGDALSHGATVKSFATEDQELTMLGEPLKEWQHAQYRSWTSSIPGAVGQMALTAVAMSILLILPSHLYQQHRISIAMVALIQLYVIKLLTATYDISDIVKAYEGIMSIAYHTVHTMMIAPTVIDAAKPKRLPKKSLDIVFDAVDFRYAEAADGEQAVTQFDAEIKAGEKIGIVGYSGSGKTTLTKLLLRFADVTAGSITVGGIDIRELAQADLRRHIAYVPQEPLLFHRSIAENITYAKPKATRRERDKAAKMAYVSEFAEQLPQKYDTIVGERGVKLSGGQRQRVAIARALLKDAPILVLDEATSALDSRSEKLIQDALWRLMKGRTALVIAHRLSTIQRMDRIVVMDKGRIVQQGTHDELLKAKNGAYAKLWAHQSGGYIAVPAPADTEG